MKTKRRQTRNNIRRRNQAIRKRNRMRIIFFLLIIGLSVTGLTALVKKIPIFNKKEQVAQIERSNVGGDVQIPSPAKELLEKTEEENKKKEGFSDKLQKFYRTEDLVYIYSSTNELADLVTEVPMGDYIEAYGQEGDWTKVHYKNQIGYVKTQDIKEIEEDNQFKVADGILIVNHKYTLPSDYDPVVSQEAMKSYEMMKAEMNRHNMDIKIISDYRSYEEQSNLYESDLQEEGVEYVEAYTAKPGESEHQTGRAFDFYLNDDSVRVSNEFDKTKEAEWLSKNAYKYGFILRYPRGKEDITGYQYESWHYRYVGPEAAGKIYKSGLTLEEYYNL